MRISQDNDSWAAGGVIRRDFRHDNSTPEVAPNKSLKKSKNSPRKVARNKKKDIEKQKHIADGIKGHLWVWERKSLSMLNGVMQLRIGIIESIGKRGIVVDMKRSTGNLPAMFVKLF